jgi:hypothetical protein
MNSNPFNLLQTVLDGNCMRYTDVFVWFPYGRKNSVTIFLNGQFIIVYTCNETTYKS